MAGDVLAELPSVVADSIACSDPPFQRTLQFRPEAGQAIIKLADARDFRAAINARSRVVIPIEIGQLV